MYVHVLNSLLQFRILIGHALQSFVNMIEEDYRNHMLLDNLPIAMSVFHENGDGLASYFLLLCIV
jgi:hypothetical protein